MVYLSETSIMRRYESFGDFYSLDDNSIYYYNCRDIAFSLFVNVNDRFPSYLIEAEWRIYASVN